MAQEEKSWSFWDCCCGGQWENLSATESATTLDIGMTMDEEERQSGSAATNTMLDTTRMMQNDETNQSLTDLDAITTEGSAQGEPMAPVNTQPNPYLQYGQGGDFLK